MSRLLLPSGDTFAAGESRCRFRPLSEADPLVRLLVPIQLGEIIRTPWWTRAAPT